ncbi:Serine/threonine-protein kinase PrkC [Clavibacter michiganensis]|nr:Serine/threonine-protein kinase PrkC [Clavibacter michiganensis]
MELETFEAFAVVDPLFFEHPGLAVDPAPAHVELPPRWDRSTSGQWVLVRPVGHVLPEQGWKLHVTALPETLSAVVAIVAEECLSRGIAFKHLPSATVARIVNSKYASRTASGKCVTVYPVGDDQLGDIAAALDRRLAEHRQGPRVLTDHRYGDGPVFYRFGAFLPLLCVDDRGAEVPAVRRPDGELVPDTRSPVVRDPEWTRVPASLAGATRAEDAGRTPLDDYVVTSALHFSNGGGIYRAQRDGDPRSLLLKEGRPHAAVDGERDASRRVAAEADALRALSGCVGIPTLVDEFEVSGHRFLVREHVEGMTLARWLSSRHPRIGTGSSPAESARYLEDCRAVHSRISDVITGMHDRGFVYRDLHPHNVIVGDDGSVTVIDHELAVREPDAPLAPLGAAGFRAAPGTTGPAIDLFALDAMLVWLLVPYQGASRWSRGIVDAVVRTAEDWYALDDSERAVLRRWAADAPVTASPAGERVVTRDALVRDAAPDRDAIAGLVESAWGGIAAASTPLRDDRYVPGHPGTTSSTATSVSAGTAGVLFSAMAQGRHLPTGMLEWTVDAARRGAAPAGLWSGIDGTAHVLARAGRLDEARELVGRTAPLRPLHRSLDYADGLAGIGLVLGDLARRTGDAGLARDALVLADHVLRHGLDPDRPLLEAGILRGGSGMALLALDQYRATGDATFAEGARKLVERDVAACVRTRSGALEALVGRTHYPYLGNGSAGIALVARAVLEHVPSPALEDALPALTRALTSTFVVEPGLSRGRAGLIAAAQLLGEDDIVREHLSELPLHVLPVPGGVSIPSIGLFRLSMDLATGSAGLALALGTITGDTHQILPFLPVPSSADGPGHLTSSAADGRRSPSTSKEVNP